MHILYIHQYFATLRGCTGTRSYEFAKRWVKAGHKVTMLTTVAQLTKEDLKDFRGAFLKRVVLEGIDVCAVNLPYRQQMGIIERCLSFIGFIIASSVVILFIKGIDVAYATSTPLTIGIPALAAKWFRKIPFVFEVRDQWPEAPIEMGIIKNKLLIKVLLWLERTIYKNSSAIIALSPGQDEGVRKVLGSQSSKISLIPNGCDTDRFRPDIDGAGIRKMHGWGNKFVLLHPGAMGLVNGLDFVIDAAVMLKDNPEILFVLLGEGNQKLALQRRVKELGLKSVEILPSVPKQQLPEVVAAVNVILVIIGNYPVVEHNSANKFFDGLSAGKPVLLNYSGWQRKVLEENRAGFGCDLCNIGQFVEKVLYLHSHRERLAEMGRNARLIAERKFNRDKLAAQALDMILSVVK